MNAPKKPEAADSVHTAEGAQTVDSAQPARAKPRTHNYTTQTHPALRWLVFGAALMPMVVTVAYMYLTPAPKMLKRNFPPVQTSDAAPPGTAPDLAPAPTPR